MGTGKHVALGRKGEAAAGAFLSGKGHRLLHTNYRYGHKEIDIISLDREILVFTEIKTRSSFRFGFPEDAVTLKKQQQLKVAAAAFLQQYPQYIKVRFDIVSILLQGGAVAEIMHFEDAFY